MSTTLQIKSSGIPLIDNKIQSLMADGLPCDLLTVPIQFPVKFDGEVVVAPQDGQVQYTGDVTIPAAGVTLKSVQVILGPDLCLVRFSPPFTLEQLVQSQVQPRVPSEVWSVIDKVLMPFLEVYESPVVILANADSEDEDLGTISPGINFYTTLHPSVLEPLKSLDRTFPALKLSEKTVVVHTGVMPGKALAFVVEAQLMLNIPMGTSALVMNELGLMVQKDAASAVAGATCRFTLSLGGETFRFRGGLQGETGGALTVWGALDVPGGLWRDPFGLKGLTINDLGAQVTAAAEFPFVGVGFRGGVRVGGDDLLGAELAVLYDPSAPQNTVLDIFSENGLNLPRLCRALVPEVPLDKILDAKLDQLRLRVSPVGGTIAGKSYEQGTAISGRLDLWGYHAMVDGKLDPSQGGHLYGSMDRIVIHPGPVQLLELTDAQGNGNPTVKIDFTKQAQGARISGRLNVAGVFKQVVDVEANSQGFHIQLQREGMGVYGGVMLEYADRRFHMALSPSFGFDFEVVGQPIKLNVGSTITVDADQASFSQALRFSFQAFGAPQTYGPVGWNFAFTDAASVLAVFKRFFEGSVRDFFTRTLRQAGEAAFVWVRDNVTKDAQAAADLFKNAGADTVLIAQNLNRQFGQTAEQSVKLLRVGANETARILRAGFNASVESVAVVLRNAGYATRDVAGALQMGYGAAAGVTAGAMKAAGYAAGEVGGALRAAYGASLDAVTAGLRGAGYGVNEVGAALNAAFGATADTAARALKGAGYAAGEVGGALRTVYGASADTTTRILKGAGFGVTEVGGALRSAYGFSADQAAAVLRGAGYGVGEVGTALKSAYGASADVAARALKGAGFGLSEVNSALNSAFGVTGAAASTVLKGAGFAADQVGQFFGNVGGAVAGGVVSAGKKLDPRKW